MYIKKSNWRNKSLFINVESINPDKLAFFNKMNEVFLGLTFDDVRIRTDHSKVLPRDTILKTKFSRNVPLITPLVSAPMDTVTEARLAIEMAINGGLGIIHYNLSYTQQCEHVAKVKSYLNAKLDNPRYVYSTQSMADIQSLRDEAGLSFHSFPVLGENEKVVGLLNEVSFSHCTDYSVPAHTRVVSDFERGGPDMTVQEAYTAMLRSGQSAVVLLNPNGTLAGMYLLSDVRAIVENNREHYNVDTKGHLLVGAAISVGDAAIKQAFDLQSAGADVVVIDTAHADTDGVINTLKALKSDSSWKIDVVVGNVSEGPAAKRLAEAGADGIKVGQGGGSICTTRIVAGIGNPQITAVFDSVLATIGLEIPICSDGGIRYSGDIPIAISAGADSVMVGRLLAGTDEAPGDIVKVAGHGLMKDYRGMGSVAAMEANRASKARYGQDNVSKSLLVPEGVEGLVPYQGCLSDVLHKNLEGLRRGMGYVGAKTIRELQTKSSFRRITASGQVESHPHDIMISTQTRTSTSGGLSQ